MSEDFSEKLNNFICDFYLESNIQNHEEELTIMDEAIEALKATFMANSATLFKLMTDEKDIFKQITFEFSQKFYNHMNEYFRDIAEVLYNE